MPRLPSETEQRTLLERIILMADVRPSAQSVLRHLFERSVLSLTEPIYAAPIKAREIRDACKKTGGPNGDQGVYNDLHDLVIALRKFFEGNAEGRKEPVRVEIEPGTHILSFRHNRERCEGVSRFWGSYFGSFKRTLLFYPEPQFFRHRNTGYLRHAQANSRDRKNVVAELFHVNDSDLISSYSFVASGVTFAMISLFECFHVNSTDLRAQAISASVDKVPPGETRDENIIVLETPTTNLELIRSVERGCPFRIGRKDGKNTFELADSKPGRMRPPYIDESQEDEKFDVDATELRKWALMTRRIDRTGRTVTLLSGHSRSVQGVAEVLTTEGKIASLMDLFKGKVPDEFQVFFEVQLETNYGELTALDTTPLFARNLPGKIRAGRKTP